jgi:imidazolonepropionase
MSPPDNSSTEAPGADPGLLVHADYLLTMPESPPELEQYAEYMSEIAGRDAAITGLVCDGGVWIEGERIRWVGPWSERPEEARRGDVRSLEAGVVTPGWIDCHTHAVFAGHRADEFVLRNAGRPYVEILEAGGGILNSVDALREASVEELTDSLVERAAEFVRRGIGVVEVKSGYGLSVDAELDALRAIEAAGARVDCELVPCFLGAHAVPRGYRDRRELYVDLVCEEMLPRVVDEGLADYCDVFCDRGAFTVDEARRILSRAQALGLVARIHADELSDAGAAALAAEIGAASADHLEHTPPEVFGQMAEAGVVGVLMPAVNLFLDTIDELPDARGMLAAGVELALATDFNPGSAMTQDLGLMLTLACTLHKMTPGEALRAVTIGAAKALRRDDIGRLRPGMRADLTLLDAPSMAYIPYHFGRNHVAATVRAGEVIYEV